MLRTANITYTHYIYTERVSYRNQPIVDFSSIISCDAFIPHFCPISVVRCRQMWRKRRQTSKPHTLTQSRPTPGPCLSYHSAALSPHNLYRNWQNRLEPLNSWRKQPRHRQTTTPNRQNENLRRYVLRPADLPWKGTPDIFTHARLSRAPILDGADKLDERLTTAKSP